VGNVRCVVGVLVVVVMASFLLAVVGLEEGLKCECSVER
jgi:hypothetical protein